MQQVNKDKISEQLQNKRILLQKLTQMRNQIQTLSSLGHVSQDRIRYLANSVLQIISKIQEYRKALILSTQNIQKNNVGQSIFQVTAKKKYVAEKITMYIWQVLNFICINVAQFPKELLQLVQPLLHFDLKYQQVQSINSLKNGLIFYHNLLAKLIKQPMQFQQIESDFVKLFGLIVVSHFQNNQQQENHLCELFQTTKSQAIILAEMEWIGYIFMQFFNQPIYSSNGLSLIKKVVQESGHPRIAYYMLHMIGNYFQQMVDKRITTELISGFECTIKDIKQMYNLDKKCLVQLKISQHELNYIFVLLKQNILQYKNIIREYLRLRRDHIQQNEHMTLVEQKWLRNTQILTEIFHILNNVLFIGGYNNKLQDVVIETLLQQDQLLLQYLEISYLLYRNIESTRYKSKVEILVEMEKEAKKKLFNSVALQLSQEEIEKMEIKLLVLQKILAPGQLVSILRLLTNLVHINHRSQVPFQKQPKYLHMILSLTHDSVSQATMKEWAIMFIRNVSEWSPILREQIGKIKMQMKVQ